jgi:hypothetical protein
MGQKQGSTIERKKREASLARTIERLQGKLALLATLESAPNTDAEYLRTLRAKCCKLRTQLVIKDTYQAAWL